MKIYFKHLQIVQISLYSILLLFEPSFCQNIQLPNVDTVNLIGGNIVYVNINASGANNGNSWSDAFTNIEDGIEKANSSNAQVWVAKGTYRENLVMQNSVGIYGGFNGNETSLNDRNPSQNITTIDGQRRTRTILCYGSNTVDGLTIKNGYVPEGNGGVLQNRGGGILFYMANGAVKNNFISDNSAGWGGGIYVEGNVNNPGYVLIEYNIITRNTGTSCAGGIEIDHSRATVRFNTIVDNIGHGLEIPTHPPITYGEFHSNIVDGNLFNNHPRWNGYRPKGMDVWAYARACTDYTFIGEIWDYDSRWGSPFDHPTNIYGDHENKDPRFINRQGRDFRLQSNSPCKGTGKPSGGSATNMGAIQGGSTTSETVSTPNQPSGPSSGTINQNLSYSTGGSSSSSGHTVEYQFNWGDGNYSGWGSSSQSHSYANSGNYSIQARARCITHTNIMSGWSASRSVSISADSYTLSISIYPSGKGTVSRNPNKNSYNYDETVWLTATPSSNYLFDQWGGALSGNTNPRKIIMNDNKSVTAYFKQIPEEVSTPNKPSGPASSKIDLSVTFTTSGSICNYGHAVEYQFSWGASDQSEWGFSSQSTNYSTVGTFTISARARCKNDTNILSDWSSGKSFSTSGYKLNISINPSAAGTVSINPLKYQFNSGEVVQLFANPSSDYLFDKWSGDLSGSDNQVLLIMNNDKKVIAHFKQIPEKISTPNKSTGASDGKVDQNLTFTTDGSSSNLGHSVEYQFSWGDSTESSWNGNSSSHAYTNPGTYQVRTQARCIDHPNIVSDLSESQSITITPNFYSISGKACYYSGEQPIQNVTIAVSGDKDTNQQTDTNGEYTLQLECDKNFKMTPIKAKGMNIGYLDITMYDAVLAARYSMGLEQLDDYQQIAADVDRDGNVSLFDAVLIARYTIELPSPTDSSCVSEWTFSPSERFYQNLNSNFSDQNFFGIILGNIHGSWQPPGSIKINRLKTLTYQYLDKIKIEKERVILPLIIDPEQNVQSIEIELMYDSNALNFQKIEKTKLSEKFQLFHNNCKGQLRVGMFSVTPSNGGGVLLKLIFSTNPSFNKKVFFHLKEFKINKKINMQVKMEIILNKKVFPITNYKLSQCYPNPFNNSTQFNLDLPESGFIFAVIYNIKGQEIIKLIENNFPAGHHILKWNGTDEAGTFVNSGIYLLKLVFNGKSGSKESSIRRIMLMK